MAYKDNQSAITIGGYVPQRIPVRANLDALYQALNKIDERSDKAIQQKSAITNAIGQLKLNAAEDKWKYDYAKRIEQKINDAAQYGDYSRALDVATELAGSATSSPEVIGRIRANEQYEKAKQAVDNNGSISSLTKQAWTLSNKYHYEDTYDDKGNIVGGTEWKANWTPVEEVDNLAMMKNAIGMIGISSTESSKTTGDSTKTAEGTGSGFQKVRGSSKMSLTYKQVKSQLIDVINNDPKWKASLEQEYRVNDILLKDVDRQISETTDANELVRLETKKAEYMSNITNDRGIITGDYVDVLFKKYPSLIKNFTFSRIGNTTVDTTSKDDYVNNGGKGSGENNPYLTGYNEDDSVKGKPGQNN
uniref:Minor capsid protein n=1 Tax=Geladintestivirus 4 TaxID=3233136 RepID=A0AAU8MG21_9CAUD